MGVEGYKENYSWPLEFKIPSDEEPWGLNTVRWLRGSLAHAHLVRWEQRGERGRCGRVFRVESPGFADGVDVGVTNRASQQ